MDEKETKLMEEQIAKTLIRFVDQLFHDLENAPKIIFGQKSRLKKTSRPLTRFQPSYSKGGMKC